MKTKITQTLQDFHFTLYHFEELDDGSFEVEKEALRDFYDENSNYFTEVEDELYEEVEGLLDDAQDYFDNIARQEELEQELDERKYAGSANWR